MFGLPVQFAGNRGPRFSQFYPVTGVPLGQKKVIKFIKNGHSPTVPETATR